MVFCYVGTKTFTPIKIRIFGPKTAEIGPKYAKYEIGIFVNCWLIWCSVGGLAGGCGARAESRKTPIYVINIIRNLDEIGRNKFLTKKLQRDSN